MGIETLTLRANPTAFLAAVAELRALLADRPDISPELVGRLSRALDAGAEVGRVDVDRLATGTGEVLVVFQPGDGLDRLLAAARAGDADLGTLEHLLHDFVSSLEASATPSVAAGEGRVMRSSPSGR